MFWLFVKGNLVYLAQVKYDILNEANGGLKKFIIGKYNYNI